MSMFVPISFFDIQIINVLYVRLMFYAEIGIVNNNAG